MNQDMAKKIFLEDKLKYEVAYDKKKMVLEESGLMLDFLNVLFEELREYFYKEKTKN
jgi:hypothetical protein